MPLCPHCGQEVSFAAYTINLKNYGRNMMRFNRIYSCDKCDQDFLVTFNSRILNGLAITLFVMIILANAKFRILEPAIMMPIFAILAFTYMYIWWKFVARLESYHE